MTRLRDSGDGPRRGRGRPPREPALLPPGVNYAAWRDFHAPALEQLLRVMDAEQLAWDAYEQRCKAAVEARSRGVEVEDPAPPSPESSVLACLRMCAPISADRRAETVREYGTRRRPMPGPTASMPDIVAWIIGEAIAAGIACDFDTAYQAWFVIAEMLLRDSDVAAIVSKVRKNEQWRDEFSDKRATDRAVVRELRNRVNFKREAFGYPRRPGR